MWAHRYNKFVRQYQSPKNLASKYKKFFSWYKSWPVWTKIKLSVQKISHSKQKVNQSIQKVGQSDKKVGHSTQKDYQTIFTKSWPIRQKVGQSEQHVGLSVQVGQLIPQLGQSELIISQLGQKVGLSLLKVGQSGQKLISQDKSWLVRPKVNQQEQKVGWKSCWKGSVSRQGWSIGQRFYLIWHSEVSSFIWVWVKH